MCSSDLILPCFQKSADTFELVGFQQEQKSGSGQQCSAADEKAADWPASEEQGQQISDGQKHGSSKVRFCCNEGQGEKQWQEDLWDTTNSCTTLFLLFQQAIDCQHRKNDASQFGWLQ